MLLASSSVSKRDAFCTVIARRSGSGFETHSTQLRSVVESNKIRAFVVPTKTPTYHIDRSLLEWCGWWRRRAKTSIIFYSLAAARRCCVPTHHHTFSRLSQALEIIKNSLKTSTITKVYYDRLHPSVQRPLLLVSPHLLAGSLFITESTFVSGIYHHKGFSCSKQKILFFF